MIDRAQDAIDAAVATLDEGDPSKALVFAVLACAVRLDDVDRSVTNIAAILDNLGMQF